MPNKINNKGFGLIPILVLVFFLTIISVSVYRMYESNEVLSSTQSLQLAQMPMDTTPTFDVRFSYRGLTDVSGLMVMEFRGNNDRAAKNIISGLRMGLTVTDFCTRSNCNGLSKTVKPVIKGEADYRNFTVEFPVNRMTKSISNLGWGGNPALNYAVKFNFTNSLPNWKIRTFKDETLFELMNNGDRMVLDVRLQSYNQATGSEVYKVTVNVASSDSEEFLRTVSSLGIYKIEVVGDLARTNYVKPVIAVNNITGQATFTITALKNTKSFYITPSRKLNPIVSNYPSGWKLNANGDGVDRIEKTTVVDISPVGRAGNYYRYEVKVTGADAASGQIETIIRTTGVNMVYGKDYSSAKTVNLRPRIVKGNGYFTFLVDAHPDTLSIYVKSPYTNIKAVPGKIPTGWRINAKSDGLDRVGFN